MSLTDAGYWDRYWEFYKLPCTIDEQFSFDRCLARALRPHLAGHRGDVLEIGCAPGKWLAMLAKEFGFKPSGIDYSAIGIDTTIRNFQMLGIEPGFVRLGNFFEIEPQCCFNIVISLGFIEHFDNVGEVVARHLDWLLPGGLLVIGIPNLRGIYNYLQTVLDRTVLDKHNRLIMDLNFFRKIAERYALSIRFLSYLGSFEPALPVPLPGIHNFQQLLVKTFLKVAARLRRIPALDHINHPFFSSYILAVYQKNE